MGPGMFRNLERDLAIIAGIILFSGLCAGTVIGMLVSHYFRG